MTCEGGTGEVEARRREKLRIFKSEGIEVYVLSFLLFQSCVLSLKWKKNEKLNLDG